MNQESIDYAVKAIERPELLLTKQFADWYAVEENRQLYLDLKAASDDSLLHNLKDIPYPESQWLKFRSTIGLDASDSTESLAITRKRTSRMWYWSAAACVAVAIGGAAWLFTLDTPQSLPEPNHMLVEAIPEKAEVVTVADALHGKQAESPAKWLTTETTRGMATHIILADGSQIDLNAESSISYPETFSGNVRKVYLEGEAFFDVTSDPKRPFIVETPEMTTRVLGTEFNVCSYKNAAAAVTVVEGRVEVASNETRDKTLVTPGEMATLLPDGALKTEAVNLDRFTSWRTGYYYFEDEKLEDIMRTLGRWYNVNVEFRDPEPLALRYNLWVDRTQPISNALDILSDIGNARFSISGITVTIQEQEKDKNQDNKSSN